MAYGITSSSQLIDVATINSGCDTIDDASDIFKKCSSKLDEAANTCDMNALSVDGMTMQPAIEELADNVKALKGNVTSFTSEIRNIASEIYNVQSAELKAYEESLKNKR